MHDQLTQQGYFIIEGYFTGPEIAVLESALDSVKAFEYTGNGPGNLLTVSNHVAKLAVSDKLLDLLNGFPGTELIAIKAFVLDKNKQFNWTIPWHQDLKIALKNRTETEGYSNWTTEAGIPHAEPPQQVMESLFTIRIHLDDCDRYNGAMEVIPGSHRHGKIAKDEIDRLVTEQPKAVCSVKRGGIMVFKPLLLHFSPLSEVIGNRRILQIEFAPKMSLAGNLEWHI